MDTKAMIYRCNAGTFFYEPCAVKDGTKGGAGVSEGTREEVREAQPDGGICITGYEGNAIAVYIPERIDERPVTVIGKKAFLSAQGIEEIHLPDTVTRLEDWAFASCRNLR